MKKSTKAMIISLCLSPVVLLTACVPPPSYTITASSSDLNLGYVKGYHEEQKEEGSKVTLTAVPTSDSAFICWVKDDKEIVSKEEKLNLTYNNKTAGNYTAVFDEPDISKMQYASIADFSFTPTGYSKVEYQVNTALLSSGSSDYYEFINGSYTIGQEEDFVSNSVIYFGGIGDEYTYLIKINFKLYSSTNEETTFEYTLQTKLTKENFVEGETTITEEVSVLENTTVGLKFEKLRYHEPETNK